MTTVKYNKCRAGMSRLGVAILRPYGSCRPPWFDHCVMTRLCCFAPIDVVAFCVSVWTHRNLSHHLCYVLCYRISKHSLVTVLAAFSDFYSKPLFHQLLSDPIGDRCTMCLRKFVISPSPSSSPFFPLSSFLRCCVTH